ncbi:MAG: hypothetical protein J6U75_06850 [Clostridia bacterium]|nr:hypothetical protein [Clostridia bacterium]
MKKKTATGILLFMGIFAFYLSFLLTSVSTTNKNIIGGADFSTFCFVFFNEKHGLYVILACVGCVMIAVSVVLRYLSARHK